jgi:hypothetical protein
VFAISPTDEISIVRRLPQNCDRLEFEGWVFLSASGWWDSGDLERLSQATGLYAISPSYGEHAAQAWWKAYMSAYLRHGNALAAITDIGEPAADRWDADPASLGVMPPVWTDACADEGSTLNRLDLPSIDKWIAAETTAWAVQVPAEHLLPKMHVEFILRRAGKGRVSTHFHELILARLGSELAIHGQRSIVAFPAWGSWPSPVAVNCDLFVRTVRASSASLLAISFSQGILRIDGTAISAREL